MDDLNLKDQHGQPTQVFRPNIENNISKAFDRLIGLCLAKQQGSEYQDKCCIFLKSKHSCTLRLPLCNDGFKSRLNLYL